MGLLDLILRRRKPLSPAERRELLLREGRLTDGTIIDTAIDEAGSEIAYFWYSVNGVDFESSEPLTEAQRANPAGYAPGARIGVRFDPKNHGNAVIV